MGTQRSEVRIDMRADGRGQPAGSQEASPGEPFRILVVADLSGRASRGICEPQTLAGRKCVEIDRDNFDEVLARLQPRLNVQLGTGGAVAAAVTVASLDDFHPDALFGKVEVFARLRALRERLLDPRTSAAAIAELSAATARAGSGAAACTPGIDVAASPAQGEGLFESALRATEASGAAALPGSASFDRLIRDLVAPHVLPRPDARLPDLVADVERAIAEQMRTLLAAPAFRDLEGAWRGLHLLTSRLETDSRLQILVLDASHDEVNTSLAPGGEVAGAALAKHLVDATIGVPGGVPYALVVGAWTVHADVADIASLGRIASLCSRTGTAFVAAAAPGLFGCRDFAGGPDPDDWCEPIAEPVAAEWLAVRDRPEAVFVGLVAPRFLLRLPYGQRSSPTSAFAFEEETAAGGHEQLLWGNGAFLVAAAIATTWRDDGWRMRLGACDEIAGLPLHVRRVDGETASVPIAEVELTSRGAERMGEHGVMALFSVRGADAVRLGSFRSIAASDNPLTGRWRST